MTFAVAILYLIIYILAPADLFQSLQSIQVGVLVNLIGFLALVGIVLAGHAPTRLPETTLQVLFLLAAIISLLVHFRLRATLDSLQTLFPLLAAYIVTTTGLNTQRRVRAFAVVIVLLQLSLSLLSISAYHTNDTESPWLMLQRQADSDDDSSDWVPRAMALGTLNDPNAFAQFLICTIPLWWIAIEGTTMFANMLRLLPLSLVVYASYLTRSRGGAVGLIALIIFTLRKKLNFATIALILSSAGVLASLLSKSGREVSFSGGVDRMDIWSDGLGFFMSSPLFGIGYGNFAEVNIWTAHNSFLLCLTELGLVGAFFWVGLFVATYMHLRQIELSADQGELDPQYKIYANAAGLSLFTYLSMCWFLSRSYSVHLFLLVGLSAAIIQLAARDGMPLRAILGSGAFWKTVALVVGALTACLYLVVRVRWLMA